MTTLLVLRERIKKLYARYGGIVMLILVATGVLGKPLSIAIDAVYAWLVPLAQLACDGVFHLFYM